MPINWHHLIPPGHATFCRLMRRYQGFILYLEGLIHQQISNSGLYAQYIFRFKSQLHQGGPEEFIKRIFVTVRSRQEPSWSFVEHYVFSAILICHAYYESILSEKWTK